MLWLSLLSHSYSFVCYPYLIEPLCIDFFCIFLLNSVRQKFKTTSWKTRHIIQTQVNGLQKIWWLGLDGLKPAVPALTRASYLGDICPLWCDLCDSSAYQLSLKLVFFLGSAVCGDSFLCWRCEWACMCTDYCIHFCAIFVNTIVLHNLLQMSVLISPY